MNDNSSFQPQELITVSNSVFSHESGVQRAPGQFNLFTGQVDSPKGEEPLAGGAWARNRWAARAECLAGGACGERSRAGGRP